MERCSRTKKRVKSEKMSDTEEEIGEALEMAEIEEMEATFDRSLGLDDDLGWTNIHTSFYKKMNRMKRR